MKPKYFRRNKWNILTLFISIIFTGIMEFNLDIGNSDILTLNSLFAGFLFTGLGIIASLLGIERIVNLDKAGYLDNYINSIYLGLFFHLMSIIITLISVLKLVNIDLLSVFSQSTLIIGLIFFIKSVFGISGIISKIRTKK